MTKRRNGVVSVVLVNFRGTDDTLACIAGLRSLDWPADKLEIVVVENGSGDDSLARLKAEAIGIVLIESKKNLGFAGGSNLGFAKSSGEYVAFLNNDARPHPDWVTAAVDTFGTARDIGAIASKVLDWEGDRVDYVGASMTWFGMGYKPHATEKDAGAWDTPSDVLFGTGAAMFVRSSVFEELGGFDESFFMFYEDVDFGWRLNLRGYRFRYEPRSLAYHRHHASMAKFGEYHELYLLERNALATLVKNLGDAAFDRTITSALLLTVRRAIGRAGLDSNSFDLRATRDDGETQTVQRDGLAGIYAIDQLVEQLPGLMKARAEIQATRTVSDQAIRRLVGDRDEPAFPIGDHYLDGYETIVTALDTLSDERRRTVLVVTGDPLGERMAGPAIRAWNIAEQLSVENDVRLVTLNRADRESELFEVASVDFHRPSTMRKHEDWADVIVVQGHAVGLFPALMQTAKVLVVDVYDPLHLEQLEQGRGRDLALWSDQVDIATDALNHQLQLGDFFLCASPRQRDFWLGQLASLGRVNPYTYSRDDDLDSLIAVVPFGVPAADPRHERSVLRGVVPGIGADDKVIIWGGGIYNWFDPETLILAVDELVERHPEVKLFFMGTQHPNPDVPEMAAALRSRELSAELGLTGTNVFFNESWVDYDDRQNYLLEADIGVSTHFRHIETTFSFRTRILDYIWAGLPIVTTDGDSFADLVAEHDLGAVVPERDPAALAAALESLLYDRKTAAAVRTRVEVVREDFRWSRTLQPLIEFCRNPIRAADKMPSPAVGQAGVSTTASTRQPRVRRTGVRRDLQRVGYYLRNGGVAAVVERFQARRARRRISR